MGMPLSVGRPWLRVAAGSSFDARVECLSRSGGSSLWRITKEGEEPVFLQLKEDAEEGTVRSIELIDWYND